VSVSLPERRYDLVGEVMAEAVDRARAGDVPVTAALRDAAHQHGRDLAAQYREKSGHLRPVRETSRPEEARSRTAALLAEQGYEPRASAGEITLANCPFDRLAARHTELVCGLNLGVIEGVVDGLGADGLTPELAPRPGFCCVRISG
jgi:predicted ArsR family transcriptional regulator